MVFLCDMDPLQTPPPECHTFFFEGFPKSEQLKQTFKVLVFSLTAYFLQRLYRFLILEIVTLQNFTAGA